MSVPLDRLYHYLADVVNHDLVIYRWTPHGSKKLCDLKMLKGRSYIEGHVLPIMICHDQEPLDFYAWTSEEFEQRVIQDYQNSNRELFACDAVAKHHARWHLRSVVANAFNFYDTTLLLHSEKNSKDLVHYQKAGFVPVYYWSHAVIAGDWFRYAEHDQQLDSAKKHIVKNFLIYNRAWAGTREYRLYFTEQIAESGLSQHCEMSFNCHDNDGHYRQHQFTNPAFQITNFNLEDFFPANTHTANASADYSYQDYQSTAIEIVLETVFDDTRWHLTEKTLRPIACGQPFMLCATPGSLRYIREYGFETFDGLIDESYDDVVDAQARLHSIINEMQRIQQLPADQQHRLHSQLAEISRRNQQRFFSTEFQQQVIQELQQNFAQGITVMNQHRTGKKFSECVALYESIPGYHEWQHSNNFRSPQDYQQVLDELAKCIK